MPNGTPSSRVHGVVTTAEAVADAEAGTGERFEDFFRATYPRLAQAGLLLTGDLAEAEDLAQEAMARAFERWDRIRRMDSPVGYVYRTALNLHRKRLRRDALLSRLRLRDRRVAPDPAEEVGPRDEALRLLATLSREQREAVVLTEWLGLTAQEAGRALGIDPASVRGRVHRARAAIRERRGDDDE
jgi:RNA polymerase sigma factor (sigma-70 family)